MGRAPQQSGFEMDAVCRCFSDLLPHALLYATLLQYRSYSFNKHLPINHTARDILSEDLISEHDHDGMLLFTAKERITYIYCL